MVIRRVDVSRPVRALNLTAKLKDTANASTPELSFQRKAVQDFHSRSAESAQAAQVPQPTENNPDQLSTQTAPDSPSCERPPASTDLASQNHGKRSISVITEDDRDDGDGTGDGAESSKRCKSVYISFPKHTNSPSSATPRSQEETYNSIIEGQGQECNINYYCRHR